MLPSNDVNKTQIALLYIIGILQNYRARRLAGIVAVYNAMSMTQILVLVINCAYLNGFPIVINLTTATEAPGLNY